MHKKLSYLLLPTVAPLHSSNKQPIYPSFSQYLLKDYLDYLNGDFYTPFSMYINLPRKDVLMLINQHDPETLINETINAAGINEPLTKDIIQNINELTLYVAEFYPIHMVFLLPYTKYFTTDTIQYLANKS